MTTQLRPHTSTLLRLIVELKGAGMATNLVFLEVIGERDPRTLVAELEELEELGLVAFAAASEQWTPTFAGLTVGLSLPAYDPAEVLLDDDECAA